MCPLQIINDTEPLSLILHGVNGYLPPIQFENYSISHYSETDRLKQKKKPFWVTYFYTLVNIYT